MRSDYSQSADNYSISQKKSDQFQDKAGEIETPVLQTSYDQTHIRGSLNQEMIEQKQQNTQDQSEDGLNETNRETAEANDYEVHNLQNMTYEQALAFTGGFGLFQFFSTTLMISLFNAGSALFYGLTFLERRPRYLCQQEGQETWSSCKAEDICGQNLEYPNQWRIDYESTESYFNWVDPSNLNLTCVDDRLIGLIGSMYFLAWGAFSIITPNLADRFGRKWILFTVSVMQVICAILLQLSKSIYFTIGIYFLIGISASGRVTITTTYMSELVWNKHRIVVNTLLHVGDGFVMVF